MNETYMTVIDVAEKIGIKPVTVYKYLREGKLKGSYFKIGGVYRFKKDLLDKTIEEMIKSGKGQ
jgi:excisionase family DNA binding protein